VPALVAGVAVAALAFLALAWPATPKGAVPLSLTVGSASAAGPVAVDLTRDFALAGAGAPAGAGPLTARLTLSAAGIPLGESTAPTTAAGKGWRATVKPPPYARWVAGGAITGEVTLTRGGATTSQQFTVQPDQTPLLSVMGAGSILLILFALAYLESVVRSLRRGRRRHTGPVLAAGTGLLFGAAVWMLASVLLLQVPAAGTGMACAILGAIAASSTAVAFKQRS
jgi:serine/threonine-protein kinase